MKTIALYTDTNIIGGAEKQMLLIARFLDKSKFKPLLICSKAKTLNEWCSKFKNENIKVIRINAIHKHNPKHYTELKKIIKSENIDLLHIHVWNTASGRYAFYAGCKTKTPIITTEHDVFKLSKIKAIIKRKTLKNVTTIIIPSKLTKNKFDTLYKNHKNKTKVIYPTIDTKWWEAQLTPLNKKDLLECKKNIFKSKEDTFILTTLANLTIRKQIDKTIKAMKHVSEKFPNTKLVIIGDGPEKQNLIKLTKKLKLQKHVIFLGKRNGIPKLLKSSNIFLNPSNRESFGLTNIEALISENILIATNTGIVPEIIINGKNGIILENNNPSTIATNIINIMSNISQSNQIAIEGQKTAFNQFDTKSMVQQYELEYEKLLNQ